VAWYEVDQKPDGMIVKGKDRYGDPFEKKMSPEEFIVFMIDK
jgi:hypothetical protein